jgi:GGDEF domain-containing protein
MEESLDQEIRWAAREGHGPGLVMADLDNFRQLNDAFATLPAMIRHTAGDEMLRRIGRFLGAARSSELPATRAAGSRCPPGRVQAGSLGTSCKARVILRATG